MHCVYTAKPPPFYMTIFYFYFLFFFKFIPTKIDSYSPGFPGAANGTQQGFHICYSNFYISPSAAAYSVGHDGKRKKLCWGLHANVVDLWALFFVVIIFIVLVNNN